MQTKSQDGRVTGGKGDKDRASPTAIEHYIKGTKFPATKGDLLKRAKENGAPQDVLNVMERFGEKEYGSPIDIAKEVGKVE